MMEITAKIVTEAFLMVLSVLAAPESLTEFRIDAIGSHGYMDTMIVHRVQDGVELYDEMNNELVKYMTIKAPKEPSGAYTVITLRGNQQETINPSGGIQAFNPRTLRQASKVRLNTKDGTKITLNRSGGLVYLTSDQQDRTFVIHCFNDKSPVDTTEATTPPVESSVAATRQEDNDVDALRAQIHTLRLKRKDVLERIAGDLEASYQAGRADMNGYIQAKIEVLKAEIDLCNTKAERIRFRKDIVELWRTSERHLEEQYQAGRIPSKQLREMKVALLEAEINLLQEQLDE